MNIDNETKNRIANAVASRKFESDLDLAMRLGLDEETFVRNIPEGTWEIPAWRFEEVIKEISGWGTVRTIVVSENAILEFLAPFPEGGYGRGFYNLSGNGSALEGHLRISGLSSILLVEQRFMGLRTCSVQFFDENGRSMFKVFLNRDGTRNILPEQLARFEALKLMSRSTEATA